jgi:hypothetical protein|tara:strand:+ start:1099 stop:1278 length:180 start_codon:yes stop_codon:yes gene_type:complete
MAIKILQDQCYQENGKLFIFFKTDEKIMPHGVELDAPATEEEIFRAIKDELRDRPHSAF